MKNKLPYHVKLSTSKKDTIMKFGFSSVSTLMKYLGTSKFIENQIEFHTQRNVRLKIEIEFNDDGGYIIK
jgi:hypothetical protein